MNLNIAVDGPAGSGKSTVSAGVARELGIEHIDTGAMYRALTLRVIDTNTDINNKAELNEMLENTDIDVKQGFLYMNGKDVSKELNRAFITTKVSEVSALKEVRDKLVAIQRKIAESKSVVMDGRDIGTNVLKDAKYKFYLNATLEERARRRYEQRKAKGEPYEVILESIRERDHKDATRELDPLKKADDAIEIDTTELQEEDVVKFIVDYIKKEENI